MTAAEILVRVFITIGLVFSALNIIWMLGKKIDNGEKPALIDFALAVMWAVIWPIEIVIVTFLILYVQVCGLKKNIA
jgi:hypothetical protein